MSFKGFYKKILIIVFCFFVLYTNNIYCDNIDIDTTETSTDIDINIDVSLEDEIEISDDDMKPLQENLTLTTQENTDIDEEETDATDTEENKNTENEIENKIVFGAAPTAPTVPIRFWDNILNKNPKKIIFITNVEWQTVPGTDISTEFIEEIAQNNRGITDSSIQASPGGMGGYSGTVKYQTNGSMMHVKNDNGCIYVGGYAEYRYECESHIAFDIRHGGTIETKRHEALMNLPLNDGQNFTNLNLTSDIANNIVFDHSVATVFSKDLEELDLTYASIDIHYVSNHFKDYTNLKRVCLSQGCYLSLLSYESMFENCTNLEEVTFLGNIDMSNYSIDKMFKDCSELKKVRFFNIGNNGFMSMNNAFANCSKLETIVVHSGYTFNARVNSQDTFLNCTKLMGSNGTLFDTNHIDSDYATIDGKDGKKGYFSTDTIQVNYNPNGGRGNNYTDNVAIYGNAYITDKNYTKKGYTFDGYQDQYGDIHQPNTVISDLRKNYTLQAIWTPAPSGGGGGTAGGVISKIEIDNNENYRHTRVANGFISTGSTIVIQNKMTNNTDCIRFGNMLCIPKDHLIAKKLIASPSQFSRFYTDNLITDFLVLRNVCVYIDGYIFHYDNKGILFRGITNFDNIYSVTFTETDVSINPSEKGKYYFKQEDATLANEDVNLNGHLIKISTTGKIIE